MEEIYPESECTKQDICDGKGTLHKKGYLTQTEIETTKVQIRLVVHGNNVEEEEETAQNEEDT